MARRLLPLPIVLGVTACAAGPGVDLLGGGPPGETAAVSEACPAYSEFDADGSGSVDLDEFGGAGDVLFDAWDDTGDGLLSFNEFNDCFGANAEDLFARFDDDGDRMIGRAEFMDEDLFAAWDRDGDRRLSGDEFPLDDPAG